MDKSVDNKNNFTVYQHVNISNGKIYIGITCRNPKYRWNNGNGYYKNQHFYNAINKYGWDGFEHNILYENLTRKQACDIEFELIKKYDLVNNENGYNNSYGGEHIIHSEESKLKMSKIRIGKKHDDKTKQKMSIAKIGIKNPNYNKHLTTEHKKHIADGLKKSKKRAEWIETTRIKSEEKKLANEKIKNEKAINNKKIIQLSKNGEFIKEWQSIIEIENELHIESGNISKCCNNKRNSAGKYKWKRL